jgi:hypothetical protein
MKRRDSHAETQRHREEEKVASEVSLEVLPPMWIKVKGILFLVGGILAASVIVLEKPSIKIAVLLALAIWCFCRFYYFAFYVIEHYVDPGFKFAGLWDFAKYLMRGRAG